MLEHHHEDHVDIVNVALTLVPTHYRWTFGDERDGQPLDYSDNRGIGLPYSPSLRCCPSQVQHNYLQSSFASYEQGGFPVHLTATWSATAIVTVTRDAVLTLNETLTLAERAGDYDFRYQVRESQPVIVR